jgi:hypothetical protein
MTRHKILTILFSSILLSSYGQVKKSEQELKGYLKHIKAAHIDTLLIVKSGCTGCDVVYKDTSKSVRDGQSISVLTKHNGKYKIATFDDIHKPRETTVDTCSFFDILSNRIHALEQKNIFYKNELAELKKVKFFPPSPVHYSFEELTVSLPNFKYEFMIVDKNADYMGFIRESESWFIATKEIVEKFFSCLKQPY